jgi:hypothetical protein
MILSIADISVEIPEEINSKINAKIEIFGKQMKNKGQSIDFYASNRNTNKEAATLNTLLGKKAEFIAMCGFKKEFGFPVLLPDLKIRQGWQKGWDKDLPYSKIESKLPDFHVKSCDSWSYSFCDDYSWTFQYNNSNGFFGRDSIFSESSAADLVAMVYIDHWQSRFGVIKVILPWSIVCQYLKDPIKKSHVGKKKCLYYKDLLANKEKIYNQIQEFVAT